MTEQVTSATGVSATVGVGSGLRSVCGSVAVTGGVLAAAVTVAVAGATGLTAVVLLAAVTLGRAVALVALAVLPGAVPVVVEVPGCGVAAAELSADRDGAAEGDETGREPTVSAAGSALPLVAHPATVPTKTVSAARAAVRVSRVRGMLAFNAFPVLSARSAGTRIVKVDGGNGEGYSPCALTRWGGLRRARRGSARRVHGLTVTVLLAMVTLGWPGGRGGAAVRASGR